MASSASSHPSAIIGLLAVPTSAGERQFRSDVRDALNGIEIQLSFLVAADTTVRDITYMKETESERETVSRSAIPLLGQVFYVLKYIILKLDLSLAVPIMLLSV